jgi:arylsulfatase A-like enzyme
VVSRLAHAAAVGLVVGVFLGLREGLATLGDNAYARSGEFAWGYLLAPVAVWAILGPALGVLASALFAVVRRRPSRAALTACCTAAGAMLWLVPDVEHAAGQMRAMGARPGAALTAVVAIVVVLLVAGAASAAGAAAARMSRTAASAVLALAVVTSAVAFASAGALLAGSARPDVGRSPVTARSRAADDGTPNVVLVSIDTLRADELGSYGSGRDTTPALDALASTGVTFRTAISSSSWTLPSVASLMTALHPRRHGAGWPTNRRDPLGRSPMRPELWTLAGAFAERGYETRAIVTNPYLLPLSGLASGFEHYENLTFLSETMIAGEWNAGQWLLDHLAPSWTVGDRGSEVTRRATTWLAATHARPFFLWLHYIDPHAPYAAVATTVHKTFRSESLLGVGAGPLDEEQLSPPPSRLRSGEIQPDASERAAIRRLYRMEVARVDAEVGRVVAALDRTGLRERTIVVCVADHGEEFWEHGGVEHGHSVYDEVVRVPLVMSWPGRLPAGRVVDPLVRTIDVAPTLVELAGLARPADVDGESVVPLLDGADDDRTALTESMLFATERVGVRTASGKMVRWENGREEVYDLTRDPGELRDVASGDRLATVLRTRLNDVEPADASAPVLASPRDDSHMQALRALGYVQ